jgi:hypothetical protein
MNNQYFSTFDLALTAAISMYIPLDSIDKSNPNRAEFVFKREEGIDQLIQSYWRGDLKVEPKLYFSQLKIIKSRLYDHSI